MSRSSRWSPRALGAATWVAAVALSGCDDSGATGGDGGSSGTSTGGSASASGGGGTGGATGTGGSGNTPTGGTSGTAGSGAGGNGGSLAGSGGTAGSGVAGSDSSGSGGTLAGGGGAGASGAAGGAGVAGNAAGMGGASGASAGSGGAGNAGAGGKASMCPRGTPSTGGMRYCSNSKGNTNGGYSYELWAEGTGTGCMTVFGSGAKFSATWTDVDDFLARVGLEFDRTRTHAQIGTLVSDFAETKTDDGGLTYIGIYGWTVNPLREYYILDDWGATKPGGTASDGSPRTSVGTLTADGETYDVWKNTRVNKPAITGDNMTFDQYFSIRRTARQCGRISISRHFSEWTSLGLQLGNLVEAKLLLEAQGNSGTIEFTTATVEVE